MSQTVRRDERSETEPVRVLGRGLRARRGIHLTLRALRDGVGMTQQELARDSKIDQADISRLEARAELEGCQVATLARYVEALGGKLELVARFDDRAIALVGVEAQPVEEKKRIGGARTSPRKRA